MNRGSVFVWTATAALTVLIAIAAVTVLAQGLGSAAGPLALLLVAIATFNLLSLWVRARRIRGGKS